MRIAMIFTVLGLTLVGSTRPQAARAGDDLYDLAPGDKWLECWIAKTGEASADDLYAAVARALDGADDAALAKLFLDRCAFYRLGEMAGWTFAQGPFEAGQSVREEDLLDLRARLEIEGVKLVGAGAITTVTEEPSEEDDGIRTQVSVTEPLPLSFDVVAVDGRWYLASMPSIDKDGATFTTKAKKVMGSLGKALAKKGPDAAKKALEGWWKKNGADLERLVRAARTLRDEASRAAWQAERKALSDKLGPLAGDDALAERLEGATQWRPQKTGVAMCDGYLERLTACLEKMPTSVRVSMEDSVRVMTGAFKTAADAGAAGVAALEEACAAAWDAFIGAGESLCPGVDLGRPQ